MYYYVSVLYQPEEDVPAVLRGEIQRNAFLATIKAEKVGTQSLYIGAISP
ncbi:unnamed protein product, partial [marine sediment metagenome]